MGVNASPSRRRLDPTARRQRDDSPAIAGGLPAEVELPVDRSVGETVWTRRATRREDHPMIELRDIPFTLDTERLLHE